MKTKDQVKRERRHQRKINIKANSNISNFRRNFVDIVSNNIKVPKVILNKIGERPLTSKIALRKIFVVGQPVRVITKYENE